MKKYKGLLITMVLSISLIFSSCSNALKYDFKQMESELKGLDVVVQTYDENSNIIDRIEGKSVSVSNEDKFDVKNEEGNTISKSSVIGLTIGGKSMVHTGSSLLMYEKGLTDIFDKFSKTVDIKNFDRSTPFLNRMVNDFKNLTTGKNKVILIRSQSGFPLATFVGNNVSYFSTDIEKSTGIIIDGKYLFIYRCDYSIYDLELIQ